MPQRPTPCGPLDIGDQRGSVPSGRVPLPEIQRTLALATASPEFDGPPAPDDYRGPVVMGPTTVAKAQHREHELLSTALWFADFASTGTLPLPALLDHGVSDSRWWLVLQRRRGQALDHPTPATQRALGESLRAWHETAPLSGLALDDPGAVGVFLGTSRRYYPEAYLQLAALLCDACQGLPMTAIHGDVAVGHNTLYQDGSLTAILDPGAIHIAPAVLDLAWCLAVDLPRAASVTVLLDAYGRDAVDHDALTALLPLLMLRRLLDCYVLELADDARWLTAELERVAPALLKLAGDPVR